jgi:hypothetical protein
MVDARQTRPESLSPGLSLVSPPPAPWSLPPEIAGLAIDPAAPLLIVDVDEVLAMFMRGFEAFVGERGLEMRIDRFALFQNIFRPGASEHLDLAEGRILFDAFFEARAEEIDAAPGASEALAAIAKMAGVVVLTNAPCHGRGPRRRWLERRGFPYPLVVNAGLKGPAVAALAARTAGPVAFIDDLLAHLESVAEAAPQVHRFQMVADERLRPLAFAAPKRHRRIDDWPLMGEAIAAALTGGGRR